MLKYLIISFSLTNLFFIRSWDILLRSKGYFTYLSIRSELLSLMVDCFFLMVVLFCIIIGTRKGSNKYLQRLLRFVLIGFLVFPINYIRMLIGINTNLLEGMPYYITFAIAGCLFVLFVYFVSQWRQTLYSFTMTLVLISSPYILVNFSQACWLLINTPSGFEAVKSDQMKSVQMEPSNKIKKNRVLWLIFDEMDKRLAFDSRPNSLKMLEFDGLISQSFYGKYAYPPARETLRSLPALISGKLVSKAKPASSNDLLVMFDGMKKYVSWSAQPNVFSKAQGMGYKTALIGFYHPYCRILSKDLNGCYWKPQLYFFNDSHTTFLARMLNQVRYSIIISEKYQLNNQNQFVQHVTVNRLVLAEALKAAVDPKLGLVLIHFPIPHLPVIYDRVKQRLSDYGQEGICYLDNLAMADLTLGKIRQVMENYGYWNQTTILISSDHWLRNSEEYKGKTDHRVPFILKLANQHQYFSYEKSINTVITHDLILSILKENLSTPKQVAEWLDKNRVIAESPYYNKLQDN